MHLCRYESRGLFFQPPIVGLIQGLWTVNLPAGMNAGPTEFQLTWASQDEILDTVRDGTALAARYRQHIEAGLDRLAQRSVMRHANVPCHAAAAQDIVQLGGMTVCMLTRSSRGMYDLLIPKTAVHLALKQADHHAHPARAAGQWQISRQI